MDVTMATGIEAAHERLGLVGSEARAGVLVDELRRTPSKPSARRLLREWFNLCDALEPWTDARMADKVTHLPLNEGDVLSIRLCPYCKGREPELSACSECEGAGLFDNESKPFFPPPPFNTWTPERIAALSAASARRGQGS